MKLSSKTVTAIKMFIDLGEHYEDGYISLIDIASRKDLSKKFLEQIVPLYKNSGLIIGTRGNQGGYRLAKAPNKVSLKDIIYLSETGLENINYQDAIINGITSDLDKILDAYFTKVTLDKLIETEQSLYSNNYCI